MHQSVIVSVQDDQVIPLRESYLRLCGGKRYPAYLLSVLEYWTNHEMRENEIRRRINSEYENNGNGHTLEVNDELWVQRTRSEIEDDSLGILKKDKITDAAKYLVDKGLIETDQPYIKRGDRRKYYRLRIDKINHLLVKKAARHGQRVDRPREMGIQKAVRDRQDDFGPSDQKFSEDDWQYKYALRWWDRQEELEERHGDIRLNKEMRKKKGKILQQWADVFRWVVEVREIPREDLNIVLKWAFHDGCWWTESGNLISPAKFKESLSETGRWRIHEFLMKARQWKNKSGSHAPTVEKPSPGDTVTEWEYGRIIETYPDLQADMKHTGFQEDNPSKKVYLYQPDSG